MNPHTTTHTLVKRLMKDAEPVRYLFSRYVYIFRILGAGSHLMLSLFFGSVSSLWIHTRRRQQQACTIFHFCRFFLCFYCALSVSTTLLWGFSVPMFLLCFNVSLFSSAPSPSGLFDCDSDLLIIFYVNSLWYIMEEGVPFLPFCFLSLHHFFPPLLSKDHLSAMI